MSTSEGSQFPLAVGNGAHSVVTGASVIDGGLSIAIQSDGPGASISGIEIQVFPEPGVGAYLLGGVHMACIYRSRRR